MYSDDSSMPTATSGITGTSAATPRYAYLVARLRNRQITMDEATELFGLQQSAMSALLTRAQAESPAPSPESPTAQAEVPPAVVAPRISDDALWLGLLAVGAGAGLFAALLQKARDGGSRAPGATKAAVDPR